MLGEVLLMLLKDCVIMIFSSNRFCSVLFCTPFYHCRVMFAGNYTPRPQQLANMQYGASQGYGAGPGGQQNPQTNNMGPGQYQGRPMPNHVPQFPYQVSASRSGRSSCVLTVRNVGSCQLLTF
jgi:hypothetical protein